MLIFVLQNNLKLNEYLHQSPTGHPNQIYKANKRQTLHVVRQYLQIFHKIYRNLSRRGHKKNPISNEMGFLCLFLVI